MAGEAVIGIRLTADGSGFIGAIDVSRAALKNLRDETNQIKPAAETSFGGAASAIKNFLGVVAAGSFAHFIAGINAADAELVDLSKKTGIAVEELSRYDKVCAVSGKSMGELADYSVKLGQKLIEAIEKPTSSAARAMEALGFSNEETARLMQHPEEALQRIAQRMGEFKDGTEKNAVALALFGKQGKDVVPILGDIASYTRDTGAVTKEQAEKSKYLTDQFALTKVKAGELGREFLTGLLPSLVDLGNALDDVSGKQSAMRDFGEGVGDVLKGLASSAAILSAMMKNIGVDLAFFSEFKEKDIFKNKDKDEVADLWKRRNEMIAENNAALEKNLDAIWKNAEGQKKAAQDVDVFERLAQQRIEESSKKRLKFIQEENDANDKRVKEAEVFLNSLKKEVDTLGMDDAAKKRLQVTNLNLSASQKKLALDNISTIEAWNKRQKEMNATVKEYDEWLKKVEITSDDLNKISEESLKKSEEHLKKLETEIKLMGLSNEEREVTIALLEAEKNRVGLTTEEYEEYCKKIEEAARMKYALEENKKAQEEMRREWVKTGDQIEQALTDSLIRSLDEGKLSFKSFIDYIKKMAIASAIRIPIQYLMGGSLGNTLGNFFGGGQQGGGNYGNILSLFSNSGSSIASFAGMIGQGEAFANFASQLGFYGGDSLEAFLATNQAFGTAGTATTGMTGATTGLGQSMSAMMTNPYFWIVAAVASAMAADANMYQKGWRIADQSSNVRNTPAKISAGLSFIDPGLFLASLPFVGATWGDRLLQGMGLGGKFASVLTGSSLFTRVFGLKKPQARGGGVEGNLTMDGFTGRQFQDFDQAGGFLRRGRHWTEWDEIDSDLQRMIDQTIGKVPQKIKTLLEEFNLDFNDVFGEDWAEKFHIVLTTDGKWENLAEMFDKETTRIYQELATTAVEAIREGWGQYVEDLKYVAMLTPDEFRARFARIVESLAILDNVKDAQQRIFGVYDLIEEDFEEYAQTGERIYDTISRLAQTFTLTNRVSDFTGIKFDGVGLDSTDARQSLIDDAGGADSLNEIFRNFFSTFATPTEQLAAAFEPVRDIFDQIGIDSIPRTTQAYRDLIAAQDMNTDEGRAAALRLMEAAGLWRQSAGAFEDMKNNLSASIDDMRRAFELDGLSNEEKYRKLKAEGDAAYVELQSATDPYEIQRLLELIKNDMNASWSLLSEDQKNAQRAEFLRRLDELEAMGLSRIDVSADEYLGVQNAEESIADAGEKLAKAILDVAGQLGADISGVTTKKPSELPELLTKPAIEELTSLLKPTIDIDEAAIGREFENALKPLLIDRELSDSRSIELLQNAIDRVNIDSIARIDTDGVSRELTDTGSKLKGTVETAGVTFERAVSSAARMMAAAAEVPQRLIVEFVMPPVRTSEAN